MTTLADIRTAIRTILNDPSAATWSNDNLDSWIRAAIADYSTHFKQTLITIIPTTDTDTYALPSDTWQIVRTTLDSKDKLPLFPTHVRWGSGLYYHHDTAAQQIQLDTTPAAGLDLTVTTTAPHDSTLAAGDAATITIPTEHQNIISHFVQWQATLSLQHAQQQNPTSNSSLLMSQLASNAVRIHDAYNTALQRAIYSERQESTGVQWQIPDHLQEIYE